MSSLAYHADHFKKGAVGAVANHNWQKRSDHDEHSNQDIDPSRSHLNMLLRIPENSLYADVKSRVEQATGRVTAASNWLSETIVYPPDDVFARYRESEDDAELRRYFQDVLDWHDQEFGRENVRAGVAHMDETTPHIHIDLVPMTVDGRLSSKEIFARKNLNRHHTELAAYLQERGWNIQRGQSTKGKSVRSKSVKEYKRWAEATKDEMAKEIAMLEEQLADAKGDLEVAKLETSIVQDGLQTLRKEYLDLQGDLQAAKSENDALRAMLHEQHELIRTNEQTLADQQESLDAAAAWMEEIPDWPTYNKVADEAVALLDAFRKLLESIFSAAWVFRNRRGEKTILEALEATTMALRSKLSALLGYEAREFVEDDHKRSRHIEMALAQMLQRAEDQSRRQPALKGRFKDKSKEGFDK